MEEGTWMEWRRKILVMPETVPQKSDCALDMQSHVKKSRAGRSQVEESRFA